MKSETKTIWIIILIILCIVFIIIGTCGLSSNARTNTEYRTAIEERDEALRQLGITIDELNTTNNELEKLKSDTDRIVQQLNDTIAKNGETIRRLQIIRNTIQGENTAIGTEIEGIRQTLREITAQTMD